ncbi:acetyltransferase, GNAT family [Rhodospirillum centenum SW]|uniref:Acetyltransferase, GNAT family n=1 Tax=Rhodospirillum centenum (strain ATCC 51521 / SW) TaxID=414684 RepID=B6IYD1_RHOCS|nr:acetyltransferase, GNAT family [Rhodospirillum centenum SW]
MDRPDGPRRPRPRVRPARPEDAEVAAAMIAALSSEEGMPPAALTPALFRRQGFGPARLFLPLIAELDGRPAGVALLTRGYDSQSARAGLVVEDLYVDPSSRRCGVARALMAEAARLAQADGGAWVGWHVRRGNLRAQLFYRSLGAVAETVDIMGLSGEAFDALARE